MTPRARTLLIGLVSIALFALPVTAKKPSKKESTDESASTAPQKIPSVSKKTRGMEKRDGFLTVWIEPAAAKIWLEVPPPAEGRDAVEAIYLEGLLSGLGSNPVGLDRGQLGSPVLLRLRRLGPKVLFEVPNLRYRALSDDAGERRAATESFATSVIWAADVAAADSDGRILVELTPFLLRDHHGVSRRLRETGQGSYMLDPQRSVVDTARCLAFPDNLEFEAVLTYGGSEPGGLVRGVAPAAESVTLIQHVSLIRPPDDGYRPRRADPRIGVHSIEHLDFAVGLDQPLRRRWILRHRLQKTDPAAARSTVVEPIVFYVDSAAPEPVRSALVEGASWWAKAFEAAGFVDAYRVEVLPEGVHPLDVRYNVIQWVHRSTRGWSYGDAVGDPRTGEVITGHVLLGSLRVRQDRLLFEGLAGTDKTGTGAADDPVVLALRRIRQLAAHEVGHALGLAHNFAASTYDGRASVMDYPAPLVEIGADGELDFSQAYGEGVGTWDVEQIRYAYSEFPPGAAEEQELDAIVRDSIARGLLFLGDEDARPAGASDPRANLWDNGADAVDGLAASLRVRRIALDRFGEGNVAAGRPLAELDEVLAPVYFHHRYQLDAALKVVGGLEYAYTVRGDGQRPTTPIDGARQRRALEVILGVLEPETLDLADDVLALLAPRPFEVPANEEMFPSSTWPAFDAVGAAASAADAVVSGLLDPARLGRLADFHRRDPAQPGVAEVLDALRREAFDAGGESPRHRALRKIVQRVVVERWIELASSRAVRGDLRAEVEAALRATLDSLDAGTADAGDRAHAASLGADVERFLDRGLSAATPALVRPAPLPPGSPIGASRLAACGEDDPP